MTLLTRWGRALDPADPLPEHPRPQLVREGWHSLNGRWEYAVTGLPDEPVVWDGEIVVPFSPEAPLSGVGRQLLPDEWLWYRRTFAAVPPPGGRLLLHFGAVDQSCTVWVDGQEVGGHTGGYLPFTLDLTDVLKDEPAGDGHTLVVRVRDRSETVSHARGKQRLDRGTIWYTAQSGIWQTVWTEQVPASYVAELALVPHRDHLVVTITPGGAPHDGAATLLLRAGDETVVRATVEPGVASAVAVPDPHLWSPADPFLYDVEVRYAEDTVTSYAALRSVDVATDTDGHRRILLNGEPVDQVGVLDQGYWPDGLLTPPSDDALVHDIEAARDLGFTMIRKHVKVEPLRWYFHCDRLGMLVWQDLVNGGGERYRDLTTMRPARHPMWLPDRLHHVFGREDAAGREEFRGEARETVRLLQSCPSLLVWTVFNEGWGQFDARAVTADLEALDPTRPFNATCGWVDQGAGAIRSFHSYLRDFRLPRRLGRARVLALTEYGGYSLRVADHDWGDREYGYRHLDSPADLLAALRGLHEQLAPLVDDGLDVTVYTQLTDVEDELNGLLTYDREVGKVEPAAMRDVLAPFRRRTSAVPSPSPLPRRR